MNHESIVLAFFCSIPFLLASMMKKAAKDKFPTLECCILSFGFLVCYLLFGMLSSFRHAVQCLKTRRKTPSAQRAERSFPPPFALSSCGNQRSALFMDFSQKLYKNFGGFPVTDSSVLSL